MGRTFGGIATFYLDDTAIESWLDSVTMSVSVPVADITSFADTWQNVVAGKKNVTLDLSGSYDNASSGVDEVIFECIGAGTKTTKFVPAGGTANANNPSYNCTASNLVGTFVSSYSISLPVGDKASFSASLQNSGATVRNVG